MALSRGLKVSPNTQDHPNYLIVRDKSGMLDMMIAQTICQLAVVRLNILVTPDTTV